MQTVSLFDVNCMWIGPHLPQLEQACLLAMLKHGHKVNLFTYAKLDNVPSGIEICDIREILPEECIFRHRKTGSPSLTADMFRYQMLRKSLGIWLDTDVLLLQPLQITKQQVYGLQSHNFANNAILYLPSGSPVLDSLCAFSEDPYPVPPWFPAWQRSILSVRKNIGMPKHVRQMSWGVFGPQALTYFAKKHAQMKFARAAHVFYPIPFEQAHGPFMESYDTESRIRPDTFALHLWSHRLRKPSRLRPDNPVGKLVVDPNCYIAKFAKAELGIRLHTED